MINWRCLFWAVFSSFINSRAYLGPAASASASRPQTAREDHPCANCTEREAAAHTANLLQRQSEARRPDEGAASGDDRPQPTGDPCLVPEQAVQRQEEEHTDEAVAAAAAQWQDGKRTQQTEYDQATLRKNACGLFYLF